MGFFEIQNYTYTVDVCCIIFCLIYAILLESTFTVRVRNQVLFRCANLGIMIAAFLSVGYHHLAQHLTAEKVFALYLVHNAYQLVLICVYFIFCTYLGLMVNLSEKSQKKNYLIMGTAVAVFLFFEAISPTTRFGLYVTPDMVVQDTTFLSPFVFAYLFFSAIAVSIFIRFKRRLITRMFYCLTSVTTLAYLIFFLQLIRNHSSYTCITFAFPVVAVLFLFHYNAYDMETGMLDSHTFESYIQQHDGKFEMICLYLDEVEVAKMMELSEEFYHFNERYFTGCATFRLRDHKFIMVYPVEKNPDREEVTWRLLEDFNKLYENYLIEYKIVLMGSNPYISAGPEYIALNEYIENRMELHQVHRCTEQDILDFLDEQFIVKHLRDIASKEDLNDPRVKVYCQPVLSMEENVFSSAEALMRLELPERGFVYPDIFIPLAEKYDFIRPLSRIILNKSCKQVLEISNAGYMVDRISVNFSMMEVRSQRFAEDVKAIITETGVPFEKIAIELTESRTEYDFGKVREVMESLKALGMTFYLDDFGTGYSNFERILELPFDIIKFDRSLLRMASTSESSRYKVSSFSEMFSKSGFKLLFEGVEDEHDEELCREMNADYLQGYKYSKPIPMEQLMDYLEPGV